jgi:hypothetical protein
MVSSGLLRRVAPEDTILHSHRRENLKSYTEELLFGPQQNEILPGCSLITLLTELTRAGCLSH